MNLPQIDEMSLFVLSNLQNSETLNTKNMIRILKTPIPPAPPPSEMKAPAFSEPKTPATSRDRGSLGKRLWKGIHAKQ